MPAALRTKRSKGSRPSVESMRLARGSRAPMAGLKTYCGMRVRISAAPRTATCALVPPRRLARIGPPFIKAWANAMEASTGPAKRKALAAENGPPSTLGVATGAGRIASTPITGASTIASAGPNTPQPTNSRTAARSKRPAASATIWPPKRRDCRCPLKMPRRKYSGA